MLGMCQRRLSITPTPGPGLFRMRPPGTAPGKLASLVAAAAEVPAPAEAAGFSGPLTGHQSRSKGRWVRIAIPAVVGSVRAIAALERLAQRSEGPRLEGAWKIAGRCERLLLARVALRRELPCPPTWS